MRTRVKICGISRDIDLQAAVEAGADAIGLVFFPPSPRNVGLEQAAALARACPPMVTRVGLFVDPEPALLAEILHHVDLDVLQFHGAETPERCAGAGRRWIKALRVREGVDLPAECRRYAGAGALLLDTWAPDLPGGTGTRFAWERVPWVRETPVVLAGGLNPDNVGEAVRTVRPFAVDVSSGVESEPGIKDAARIHRFIDAVKQADRALAASGAGDDAAPAGTARRDGVVTS